MIALNGTEGNQDVVFIDGTTEQYRKLYNSTKFCLAPHGGWICLLEPLALPPTNDMVGVEVGLPTI